MISRSPRLQRSSSQPTFLLQGLARPKRRLVCGLTPVPIDDGVVAARQQTIDLYVREGVLPASYAAGSAFDRSFNV